MQWCIITKVFFLYCADGQSSTPQHDAPLWVLSLCPCWEHLAVAQSCGSSRGTVPPRGHRVWVMGTPQACRAIAQQVCTRGRAAPWASSASSVGTASTRHPCCTSSQSREPGEQPEDDGWPPAPCSCCDWLLGGRWIRLEIWKQPDSRECWWATWLSRYCFVSNPAWLWMALITLVLSELEFTRNLAS